MIENRELTVDDYLVILRRRMKLILVPMVLAPIAGFLVSYAFPPKYTSTALVQVEEQQVPGDYVKPVVTEDLAQRVASLQQQVLSRNKLQPMIDRLDLAPHGGKEVDDLIDRISQGVSVQLVQSASAAPGKPKKPGDTSQAPGFNVNFTWDSPKMAQRICTEITSMITSSRCCSVRTEGIPCSPNVMSAGSTISIPVSATTLATRSLSRSDSAFAPCRTV